MNFLRSFWKAKGLNLNNRFDLGSELWCGFGSQLMRSSPNPTFYYERLLEKSRITVCWAVTETWL